MEKSKRMGRGTYWGVIVGLWIFSALLMWVGTLSSSLFYPISGGMFVIGIAEIYYTVLRLHDTDRSGWNYLWILLPIAGPIVLLVFLLQAGTPGANRFGDVSKN